MEDNKLQTLVNEDTIENLVEEGVIFNADEN